MAVVTVSRPHGAGGREFGKGLAAALGYGYLDREILTAVAERAGTSEAAVALYEDMPLGAARTVADVLGRRFPGTRPDVLEPEGYLAVLRSVFEELAHRGRVVIVGRGGQCLLADHPDAVHVRLVADRERLLARLAARPDLAGVPREELERRIEARREDRRRFVRAHFDRDVEDPLLYHLVVNVGRLGRDEAVATVAGLVARRDAP